jgi:TetR/AcrR family tetracycline transcriptional repressor
MFRTPSQPGVASWQVWFAQTMHSLRLAMLSYPDGARVIAGARPRQTPTLARIAEYSLRALEEDDVPLATASGIVFTV